MRGIWTENRCRYSANQNLGLVAKGTGGGASSSAAAAAAAALDPDRAGFFLGGGGGGGFLPIAAATRSGVDVADLEGEAALPVCPCSEDAAAPDVPRRANRACSSPSCGLPPVCFGGDVDLDVEVDPDAGDRAGAGGGREEAAVAALPSLPRASPPPAPPPLPIPSPGTEMPAAPNRSTAPWFTW